MAFGNLNLGNIASALKLTGADPSLADGFASAQQAPVDAGPSVVPPNVNDALKATGSSYEVPATPAPAVDPETAAYLRHTGKTVDDRSAAERRNSQAEWAAEGDSVAEGFSAKNGYSANGQTWKNGQLVNTYRDGAQRGGASAPAPSAPMPEVGRVNANASMGELKQRVAGNVGTGQDLALARGDVQSGGDVQSAEVLRGDAAEGRAGIDEAKSRRDAALGRKDENTRKAYGALEDMQMALGHPPDVNKGKWLSLIGGAIASSGKGGAIGQVMQGLGQMQMSQLDDWQRGIAGNEKIAKLLTEMNDSEDKGTENELNQQSKLNAMVTANSLNTLKAIEHETHSEDVKLVAREAALKLKDQYEQHDLGIKQKLAATAAATKVDRAMYQAITAGKSAPERAAIASLYGKKGQAALQDIQKSDKSVVDIEGQDITNRAGIAGIGKTEAEAAKLRGEGGPQQIVEGYYSTPGMNLDPTTIADIRKNARAMASIQSDLSQLREIRKRNNGGTWNTTDVSTADGILARLPAKYSQMSGSGAPSETENKIFKEITSNPTDFYSRKNPIDIYDSTIASLQNNFDAQADIVGVRRGLAPTQQNAGGGQTAPAQAQQQAAPAQRAPAPAPAAPAAPQRVTLYRLDGTPVPNVKADMAQQLLQTNQYMSEPPPMPADAALASADNASYEEQVRRGL